MRLSEAMAGLGRPVAYYPELARFLGSIGAAILFQQLFYWREKAIHEYTFKKSAELETETGLSVREQRKARGILVSAGILTVEHARLQHELHFTIDEAKLDEQWQGMAEGRQARPVETHAPARFPEPQARREGPFRAPLGGRAEHRPTVVGNTA